MLHHPRGKSIRLPRLPVSTGAWSQPKPAPTGPYRSTRSRYVAPSSPARWAVPRKSGDRSGARPHPGSAGTVAPTGFANWQRQSRPTTALRHRWLSRFPPGSRRRWLQDLPPWHRHRQSCQRSFLPACAEPRSVSQSIQEPHPSRNREPTPSNRQLAARRDRSRIVLRSAHQGGARGQARSEARARRGFRNPQDRTGR